MKITLTVKSHNGIETHEVDLYTLKQFMDFWSVTNATVYTSGWMTDISCNVAAKYVHQLFYCDWIVIVA